MIAGAQKLFGNPKAFKNFNSAALHAVGLTYLHWAVTSFEDFAADACASEPSRRGKASRATPAYQNIKFLGHN